jgi:hypothetical protein
LSQNAFLEKGHNQKMFGPLFWDSEYVSDAKITFGMCGMICFAVDSQTHTLIMERVGFIIVSLSMF